jgi:uncharacterized protein
MKPSKFNVVIPDFPSPGEYLVFNTFNDSRIVINAAVMDLMNGAGVRVDLSEPEKENLRTLAELGLMVGGEVDEDRELEYWFQKLKFDTAALDVTVLTTSACNLACDYCYQDGIDLKRYMKPDVCRRVAEWTAGKLDEVRPRVLNLTLFGGEPLLNPEAARALSRSFHALAAERGIENRISLITNGVLLSEALIEELLPLGLSRVKVTLDGDEAAHDSKRHHRNGMGSYRAILNNLLALKGRAPISIGGNFDDSTRDAIPRLLDELVRLGFGPGDIDDITFKPILAATNVLPVLNNAMDTGHTCTFSDMKVSDILWLRDEVEKRGFRGLGDGIAIGPCCATREHTYTIDPYGKVYKCPALVGREEYITGDVNEAGGNYRNTRFMTVDLWREPYCEPCAYRPICGGGFRKGGVREALLRKRGARAGQAGVPEGGGEREHFLKILVRKGVIA